MVTMGVWRGECKIRIRDIVSPVSLKISPSRGSAKLTVSRAFSMDVQGQVRVRMKDERRHYRGYLFGEYRR